MKKLIRRLRLRKGDIIVCRNPADADRLAKTPLDKGVIDFDVPIVYCEGSVHRLSKEYLQKLLARV